MIQLGLYNSKILMNIKEQVNLSGRVAAITGGAGHIGMAIAGGLAELGASIVIIDINETRAQEAAAAIALSHGVECLAIAADMEDEEQVREIIPTIEDKFRKLNILINCAAFVGTSGLEGWAVPLERQSAETWRRALEVNLTSVFILCQSAAALMKKSTNGSIINISSIYGSLAPDFALYEGLNMHNPAAYGASKAGLEQLTRYLASALAPSIRVNAIAPGGVERGQPAEFQQRYITKTMMGRMATEGDFVGPAIFLASDMSSYITGQCLMVDGGFGVA
jgi:NAD(P)-dependent dehydrogenase (short-subunit alcohol dehydrogenase family)